MTIILWGKDVIPTRHDVEAAMICHRNVLLGRETWEQHQTQVGEIASWLSTVVDLCLAGV